MSPDIGEVVGTDSIGPDVTWNDDEILTLGTGDPFSFSWDDSDPNAMHLKASFVAVGAVDVAIMSLGIGIKTVDLTFFNGLTQPGYAVIDADRDSYIKMGFVSDDVAEILSNKPLNITTTGNVTFSSDIISDAAGCYLLVSSTAASSTVPVYSFDDDPDTGVGSSGADNVSIIAGAEEIARFTELGNGGRLSEIFGGTLTSGGTGDATLAVLTTLNDTGAAGGSDLFNLILGNIVETDVTGWDNVNLMSLQIGGNPIYLFDNLGTLTIGNDTATLSGKIAFIASDGDAADILINTSDQLTFNNAAAYVFDTDISIGNDLLLADGAVIGITGNEIITFNAAGTIVVSGATFTVGGQVIADGSGNLASANGASFGPSDITTITVVNGIVTAVA